MKNIVILIFMVFVTLDVFSQREILSKDKFGGTYYGYSSPDTLTKKSTFRNSFTWISKSQGFKDNLYGRPNYFFNISIAGATYKYNNYGFVESYLSKKLIPYSPSLAPRFSTNKINLDLTGKASIFYFGIGLYNFGQESIMPSNFYYSTYPNKSYSLKFRVSKGFYYKVGTCISYNDFLFLLGMKSCWGDGNSGVYFLEKVSGVTKETKIDDIDNSLYGNFLDIGIQYQNLTISSEFSIDPYYSNSSSYSISIGYNLYNRQNFKNKKDLN